MSSYIGRHAQLYDIFYQDKPYEEEAAFIDRCITKYSIGITHRLLELACGTGSHAFALEKFGYNITATDYSEDMLKCAKQKASSAKSKVDFRRQDMRTLDISNRPFDAVICLFDSIGYVKTNEALRQVLKGVHEHLRPGGLFLFEFWHAAAMLRSYDPLRVRRWFIPEAEIVRISETSLDCANQLSRVIYTIYELRRDGTYFRTEETQVNRYFLVQEMVEWLISCSFEPLKWFAGFTECENITENTWHIVAIARRQ